MVRYYSTMAESFFDSLEEAVKAERELLTEKEEAFNELITTIKDIYQLTAEIEQEQLQHILDYLNCLKIQKETGVILLPSYLGAYTVPDDIEIKLIDENRKEKTNDEHDNC